MLLVFSLYYLLTSKRIYERKSWFPMYTTRRVMTHLAKGDIYNTKNLHTDQSSHDSLATWCLTIIILVVLRSNPCVEIHVCLFSIIASIHLSRLQDKMEWVETSHSTVSSRTSVGWRPQLLAQTCKMIAFITSGGS